MAEDFGDGRDAVLKRNQIVHRPEPMAVPVGELPPAAPASGGGTPGGGEPQVEVERGNDGTIQRITITCSCGKETTLQCEYFEEGGKDAVENT